MAIRYTRYNESQRITVCGKEFLISGIKQTSKDNFFASSWTIDLVIDNTFFVTGANDDIKLINPSDFRKVTFDMVSARPDIPFLV